MTFSERVKGALDALLGVSAYETPPPGREIPEETRTAIRKAVGGQIQPLPTSRLRWYLEDLEFCQVTADSGNVRPVALLCNAMNRDGVIKGLLRGRTKGLIRLPKRYYGDDAVAEDLRARNGSRSVFEEMHPASELQLMVSDGIKMGVSLAELVPVKGRDFPVLVRLNPEFLQYRWNENRWYFHGLAGAEPIIPGNGRWVLHVPGGRHAPWNSGDWYALGRSFVNKEHSLSYRANYIAKLANPARLAYAPAGATESQRQGFFRKILAWGVNTVLELPVGWDAKLLESNGRGWEVFQRQIDTCDKEFMVTLAGQILTTQGGTGFDGQDVAQMIRQDLIQGDAEDLAYTLNTQSLPVFIVGRYGEAALQKATIVEWDTGTPADKEKETRTMGQAATAIAALTEALRPYDKQVDVAEVNTRFGIPTKEGAAKMLELTQGGGEEGGPREAVGRPTE